MKLIVLSYKIYNEIKIVKLKNEIKKMIQDALVDI